MRSSSRLALAVLLSAAAFLAAPAAGHAGKNKRAKTSLAVKAGAPDAGKISFSHREFALRLPKRKAKRSAVAARKLKVAFRAKVKSKAKLPKNLIAVLYVTKLKNTASRFAADLVVVSDKNVSASSNAYVSVTAEAPLVSTSLTAVATNINNRTLESLPTSRNFADIANITPGVAQAAADTGKLCDSNNGFASEIDGKTFVTQVLGKQIDKLDGGVELTLRDLTRASLCKPGQIESYRAKAEKLGIVFPAVGPAARTCAGELTALDVTEFITKMSCTQPSTAFGALVLDGRQISASLPPSGATNCQVTTVNTSNDYYRCDYNFSTNQLIQFNLRTSPAWTSGMRVKLYSFDGPTQFGPFDSNPIP